MKFILNRDTNRNIEIITSPNFNSTNIRHSNNQRNRNNARVVEGLDNDDAIFSFRPRREEPNNNENNAIISLANHNNNRNNNRNTENANIDINGVNANNNEDLSYNETIQEIMFNHDMRDIISSILKIQLFSFIFFIFIILWIKLGLSFYLPLIFLWVIDIYYIITDVIELSIYKKYYIH